MYKPKKTIVHWYFSYSTESPLRVLYGGGTLNFFCSIADAGIFIYLGYSARRGRKPLAAMSLRYAESSLQDLSLIHASTIQ